ncbi:MAG TPA: iron-containing alcohol dehydrogenase [Verrucomicrobiales bacterium]|nr:iron-containing alcohol dehydrogenase [Verrucomicrobiales bacterium]HIL68797.1 iron-containing alcohol dehydrogenase [Verrucomicrobiota bacterium]
MTFDNAFEMTSASVRFGPGVTREVGMDLVELGVRRVMVLTDPVMTGLVPVETVMEALSDQKLDAVLFDQVRVEPTDRSFQKAIAQAQQGAFDAFVAVGGGSVIDTAKAANLYSTYPADFLDYVNAPIGKGKPVPGPLKPLIAIPTTAGTGSETTGVAIFDLVEMHAKTGMAHRRLKPTLGLLDPQNLRTLPPMVAASAGLDVLSHAVESYTALPFNRRPAPAKPLLRPAYQGSNPISDIWSGHALQLVTRYLKRVVADPSDAEAAGQMMLAASYAGMGFGNAGVHLPHGMSYAVSGGVKDYRPPGYPKDPAIIPHGISVILNAPSVFRFTADTCPKRHLQAAEWLGVDVSCAHANDAGKILSDRITEMMQSLGLPNGLKAVGYSVEDIPALVQATLPQHRVTKLSPRPAGEDELSALFADAMVAW